MMRTSAFTLALLASLSAAASASDSAAFGVELHKSLARGKNLMSSPYSARQALGMAYAGAAGATKDEMAAALRAGPGFVAEEKAVRARLDAANGEAIIKVANAVFVKKGYEFLPAWLATVRDSFGAEVFARDFDAASLKELNGWVAKATNNRIETILDALKPDDRAVLLNAVYFKGKWIHAFPKAKSEARKRGGGSRGGPYPENFRLDGGKTFATKLMSVHERFAYAETPAFQAARLPYRGKRLAMVLVLPAEASSLAEFRKTLTGDSWRALRASLRGREGMIAMPKFKFEGDMDLVPPLKGLGMKLAFDRARADFSNMSRPASKADELFVSRVVQKTFVEVDEEGTEAAAATAAVMAVRGAAMKQEEPFRLVANRPFFFVIEDVSDGTILFLGEVHDPR